MPADGPAPCITRSSTAMLLTTDYRQEACLLCGRIAANSGLILGLRPSNDRRRYKVMPSIIGWVQT